MNEEKVILDDVSLEIREHDFITILGGNGAGKSTLFNTIAGTLPVSSGKIYILGEDVTNYSPEKRAKYLSRVFQDRSASEVLEKSAKSTRLSPKSKTRLVFSCTAWRRPSFDLTPSSKNMRWSRP